MASPYKRNQKDLEKILEKLASNKLRSKEALEQAKRAARYKVDQDHGGFSEDVKSPQSGGL